MAVNAFEGAHVLYVKVSLADEESYFEAIDVENDEFVFFTDDGTVVAPAVPTAAWC